MSSVLSSAGIVLGQPFPRNTGSALDGGVYEDGVFWREYDIGHNLVVRTGDGEVVNVHSSYSFILHGSELIGQSVEEVVASLGPKYDVGYDLSEVDQAPFADSCLEWYEGEVVLFFRNNRSYECYLYRTAG